MASFKSVPSCITFQAAKYFLNSVFIVYSITGLEVNLLHINPVPVGLRELEFRHQLNAFYSSNVLFPHVSIIPEDLQIKFMDMNILRHVQVFVRCAVLENKIYSKTVLQSSCDVVVTVD